MAKNKHQRSVIILNVSLGGKGKLKSGSSSFAKWKNKNDRRGTSLVFFSSSFFFFNRKEILKNLKFQASASTYFERIIFNFQKILNEKIFYFIFSFIEGKNKYRTVTTVLFGSIDSTYNMIININNHWVRLIGESFDRFPAKFNPLHSISGKIILV